MMFLVYLYTFKTYKCILFLPMSCFWFIYILLKFVFKVHFETREKIIINFFLLGI